MTIKLLKFLSSKQSAKSKGLSLLELIITLAILAILVSSTLPLAYNTVKRNREIELRRALRELRTAIDAYKRYSDSTLPPGQLVPIQERTPSGYPRNLEILAKGFTPSNRVDDKKLRFLRRIPVDPNTGLAEWGTRSSTDDPDSQSTNDEDVFDVYSKSNEVGLNGTKYREW
ncbi:MAG: type II secretion system protein [Acidobacteria bacterium]|nr:type II secretion system protein [Acidobacteriota bacterium]